ncbi:hypothetical protein BDV38DRAFT_261114 [Aspergillus pseudotamarii]|uniref:Uncharacterized protein n=1 Tax=Aspergillus pseudotamarii TaxID=132259 RepID=A0A5N6SF51_ASPPS|nr:uncharacterized protein BDV38DRAFT_261114 [Aspergillus pseudotamarii]KAE8132489.1 hypothetical protein BDV38DRAFT_261114 [Aspergillus pseudotamarii]
MSLKRKASFSGIYSPDAAPVIAGRSLMMDDTPKHLNSRTRKRYRNDRPDDKIVYDNTLRWLFTAQQQQGPIAYADETIDKDMESDSLPSEIADPRQQTLHKFFQPSRPLSFQTGPNHMKQQTDNIPRNNTGFLKRHDIDTLSNVTLIGSNAASTSSQDTTADTEARMDSGSNESVQNSNRWNGGSGWL